MLHEIDVVEHTVAEQLCDIGQKFSPCTVTMPLGWRERGATLLMEGCFMMNIADLFTICD